MRKHLLRSLLMLIVWNTSYAQSEENPGQQAQIARSNYYGAKEYCTKMKNLTSDTPEFERCVVATMYNPDSIVEAGVNLKPKDDLVFSKSSNKQPSINLDLAKEKCKELGFKNGTEAFGKCALRLSNK